MCLSLLLPTDGYFGNKDRLNAYRLVRTRQPSTDLVTIGRISIYGEKHTHKTHALYAPLLTQATFCVCVGLCCALL